jgi:hypothetical protein
VPQPVPGAVKQTVPKASKEGGGCVNTQTGSVRVAASQSNIVRPEDSLREAHGVLPQLIPGAVTQPIRGAMPQPVEPIVQVKSMGNIVSKRVLDSMSGTISSSRSLDVSDPVNKESAYQGVNKSEKMLRKPKFDVQTLPGGKFNLKLSSNSANNSKKRHTSDALGRGSQIIQHSRTVVHGESVRKFNNIPVISTPTKRKQVLEIIKSDATDAKLRNNSESTHIILTGSHTSESPAKRVKWGQGGPGQ